MLLGMKGYDAVFSTSFSRDHNTEAADKMPAKRLAVLSEHSFEELGRFALVSETTRLLGQVQRHKASETLDDEFHKEEALLLDRALRALSEVVEFEGIHHRLDVMNQTTMCSM